jgi:hypothetical protein
METQYRFMKCGEKSRVCSLVEKVFHEFVAPDYGPEGIQVFFQFANPKSMAERTGPEQVVVIAELSQDGFHPHRTSAGEEWHPLCANGL